LQPTAAGAMIEAAAADERRARCERVREHGDGRSRLSGHPLGGPQANHDDDRRDCI